MPINVDKICIDQHFSDLEINQNLFLTMNPIIHDVAVLCNYTSNFNNEHDKFTLKSINIKYCDFKHLFFKKKCKKYAKFDARFLNILFNKIKTPLITKLCASHNIDSKTTIMLNKEIYAFELLNEIKQNYSLHFYQFEQIVKSIKEPSVIQCKIILKMFLNSISHFIEIEFLFNVNNIPTMESDQLELFF